MVSVTTDWVFLLGLVPLAFVIGRVRVVRAGLGWLLALLQGSKVRQPGDENDPWVWPAKRSSASRLRARKR